MTESAEHDPASQQEPPPLPESYQKTNRHYVAMSALLASWELIGIELETKERWGIILKSPKAVPLILLVLVLYYAYKLKIEWLQCSPERRQNPAARLDYRVAHAIAIAAIGILLVQLAIRNQIVNVVSQLFPPDLRTLALMAFVSGLSVTNAHYSRKAGERLDLLERSMLLLSAFLVIAFFVFSLRSAGIWLTLATGIGVFLVTIVVMSRLKRAETRAESKTEH